MECEIYCDESRQDLFSSKKESESKYTLIGGVWIEASKRQEYKDQIKVIRSKYKALGEIRWNTVSPSKLDFYLDIINFFFDTDIRFRCIVIEKENLNLVRFHKSDHELGFYKFYYQLIHHWISDFNKYRIFVDFKTNRAKNRLHVLKAILSNANPSSEIIQVQALHSRDSVFIQLADLLIGAVGYALHSFTTSSSKLTINQKIEKRLGHLIQPTRKAEEKLNIFKISLDWSF